MRYTFCTLFDRNYLYKGLALYQSLAAHRKDFRLWILCMDDVTSSTLGRMRLENVELVSLEDFEDEALRKAKQERTAAEYCWTCTAPLILHVMHRDPKAVHVAYLDADLFFYSDPRPIYMELGDKSILIIEHRYSPERKSWESTSGIYNVSMVIFKNDRHAAECLNWWREQCLMACRKDAEAGLCGDQKYLDDWPTRFENVVVLQHKGGGLAPWNIANYRLTSRDGKVYVDSDELIFYHFHSLHISERHMVVKRPILAAWGYGFTRRQLALVYSPYVRELREAVRKVEQMSPGFSWGYTRLGVREMLLALRWGNLLFM
jgi:hypothetical protein